MGFGAFVGFEWFSVFLVVFVCFFFFSFFSLLFSGLEWVVKLSIFVDACWVRFVYF